MFKSFKGLSIDDQYSQVDSFTAELCKYLELPESPKVILTKNSIGCRLDLYTLNIELDTAQIAFHQTNPLVCLAHEIRHYFQIRTGILKLIKSRWSPKDFSSIGWNGKIYDSVEIEMTIHHRLPWEIDAILFEREIADMLHMSPFPRLQMIVEDVYMTAQSLAV